jgi:hypothetical protein
LGHSHWCPMQVARVLKRLAGEVPARAPTQTSASAPLNVPLNRAKWRSRKGRRGFLCGRLATSAGIRSRALRLMKAGVGPSIAGPGGK